MNDFLITVLAEDHRRELLTEARAEALAREALAGRQPWWQRLFGRSSDTAAQRSTAAVNGHMAASLISTR
jgi:hypothetical protein